MLLFEVLYLSTENTTGLNEFRRIDVPVTDLNNEDCEVTDDYCEEDIIYYFIFGECIRFLYRVIDYAIYLCSYRAFLLFNGYQYTNTSKHT